MYSQVLLGSTWIDVETTISWVQSFQTRSNPGNEDRSISRTWAAGGKSIVETSRLVALLYYNRGTWPIHRGVHLMQLHS